MVKQSHEIVSHPFALPCLPQVIVDVEINLTVIVEVGHSSFSDPSIRLWADAQLLTDLVIGTTRQRSVVTDELTHSLKKLV
jgi:hypothetical protein